nr:L-threonylcarbamoyladenylate synthase [Motilibacter aurantiacus]
MRKRGLDAASAAVKRGDLVVLPTDTVYGVGCDAFSFDGVAKLREAKGRGRDMPLPVLVSGPKALDGIAYGLRPVARDLVAAFWPGALTLVCTAQPSLQWDLGDTGGTVQVRMPLHPVAIELLTAVGPMAVTAANGPGMPAPLTADDAREQLGNSVAVVLDAGRSEQSVPSTIVDVTGVVPRVLREGALPVELLQEVVPHIGAAV